MNKELVVRQLLSNFHICKFENRAFYIKNPTADLLYIANHIYESTLSENRYDGLLREKDCERVLIERGIWQPDGTANLKFINERIENLKVALYTNSIQDSKVKKIRHELELVRAKQSEMYARLHSLDQFTVEFMAHTNRFLFLLKNTTYNDEWRQIQLEADFLIMIYSYIQGYLSNLNLRLLARTDPWRAIWRIGKPNPFSCQCCDMTDEQRSLISFSQMYDSIYEHTERPSESVIEDDDMLDGWMIVQQKKNDKERAERQVNNTLGVKEGAQEVFIMAKTIDDIKNIKSLGGDEAAFIKKNRQDAIRAAGVLKDQDLPDKKLEIQRKANEQFMQRR